MNNKKHDALDFRLEMDEAAEAELLKLYDVPVVSKEETRGLCDTVGSYLPQRPTSIWDLRFWQIAFLEMTGKSSLFWMCCAVALAIGAALIKTAMSYFSPLMVMMVLAPVPFLAFIIDMLHYRDSHVVELEMTCRYDVRQLYIAKLLIGMVFNISILIPVVYMASSVYADGWRLILCAFTTMFFIGFISLLLMARTRSSLFLSAFLALWVFTGGMILRLDELSAMFEKISIAVLAIAFGVSLVLFIIKLTYAGQHMRLCAETGGCHL